MPAREDDEAALLHVADGAAANVRLGELLISIAVMHARRHARTLERVLQRERVDDRREHAHVVALRAIHAFAGALEAAEDVAAADDDAELHARAWTSASSAAVSFSVMVSMPEPPSLPLRASPDNLMMTRL